MQEDYPSREEERGLIKKFEEQLKNNSFQFFDVSEYETIVQHYIEHFNFAKGIKAGKMALEQYPFSSEISILLAQCYIGKEEYPKALKVIDDAQNLNPNDLDLVTIKVRTIREDRLAYNILLLIQFQNLNLRHLRWYQICDIFSIG